MAFCRNCGVELENDLQQCPLCGEPIAGIADENQLKTIPPTQSTISPGGYQQKSPAEKKLTWEIISIILLSGVFATFVIDYIVNGRVTWSQYPAAVCCTIFSYISVFTFRSQGRLINMSLGFLTSSIFLWFLDALWGDFHWALKLGIPLLFAGNVIVAALLAVTLQSRYKGINIIAYAFTAASLLCMSIEGLLSFFWTNTIHLWWSLIVAGCVFPVILVLLFLHFRFRRGRSLQKTFHI
jgi:hypothetical protein